MGSYYRGFTLIELVLTLVIVSILAIGVGGLFAGKDGYTARTTADQLLAQARLAQQVALGRSASGGNTSLTVAGSGNSLSLSVTQGTFNSVRTADTQGVSVAVKTSGTTACGGGSTAGFTLQFDRTGNLSSGTHTLICISGNQTIPVCITPLGYAYEGVCES